MGANTLEAGDPFCTRCGFLLRGHEADGYCPECRAPLPAALGKCDPRPAKQSGRRVRRESSATLFGWPLVSIALGPDPERGERRGRACGLVAVGDVAIGGVAVGGGAVGVVAIGGVAVGVSAAAGLSAGLLAAVGGFAAGGCAAGGFAVGGLASGGGAFGCAAQGGLAIGVYARGESVAGLHTISAGGADPAARQMFDALAPVMGVGPPAGTTGNAMATAIGVPFAASGLLAATIGAVVLIAQWRLEARRRRRGVLFNDIASGSPGRAEQRRGLG